MTRIFKVPHAADGKFNWIFSPDSEQAIRAEAERLWSADPERIDDLIDGLGIARSLSLSLEEEGDPVKFEINSRIYANR